MTRRQLTTEQSFDSVLETASEISLRDTLKSEEDDSSVDICATLYLSASDSLLDAPIPSDALISRKSPPRESINFSIHRPLKIVPLGLKTCKSSSLPKDKVIVGCLEVAGSELLST